MKKVFKVLKYIMFCLLAFLAIICISVFIQTMVNPDKIPSIFGYKPFIVLSGSMETELYKGDLAIVKNVDTAKLKINDVIAFRDENDRVVTHRIVEIINENSINKYVTKGDNNNTNDSGAVKAEDVEGIYVRRIAGFGNVLLEMQKPMTLVIAMTIIIVGGIFWIMLDNNRLSQDERKELEQLRKEKKKYE